MEGHLDLAAIPVINKGVTRREFAKTAGISHPDEFCGNCAGRKPTGSAALTPFPILLQFWPIKEEAFLQPLSALLQVSVSGQGGFDSFERTSPCLHPKTH